jgi:hypothetical protein
MIPNTTSNSMSVNPSSLRWAGSCLAANRTVAKIFAVLERLAFQSNLKKLRFMNFCILNTHAQLPALPALMPTSYLCHIIFADAHRFVRRGLRVLEKFTAFFQGARTSPNWRLRVLHGCAVIAVEKSSANHLA